jgi:hypothetical protein
VAINGLDAAPFTRVSKRTNRGQTWERFHRQFNYSHIFGKFTAGSIPNGIVNLRMCEKLMC